MKKQVVLSAALLSCTAILPAHADRTLTYTNPQNGGGEMTLSVVGNRSAIQMPEQNGERVRIVYDQEADKIFLVYDSKQQYMDMGETMSGLSGMLSSMTENLTDEQKAKMGDLLGSLTGDKKDDDATSSPRITNAGRSETVAGIDCDVVVLESTESSSQMCIAEPGDAGLNGNDFAVLQGMMEKQSDIAKQAGQMMGGDTMSFNPGKLDGVPVRVTQLSGPDAGSNTELLGTSGDVDAATVAIPDNYQPMKMTGG